MKEGVFHAAGGAVWFETERPAVGGGLIEGSTPECRSPRQLVAWQRAQDELLAEAADEAFGGSVRLIKNDRDAAGNVYGRRRTTKQRSPRAGGCGCGGRRSCCLLPLAAGDVARAVADRPAGDCCTPWPRPSST